MELDQEMPKIRIRKKCEHDKRRSRCKECSGSEICDHGKRRSQCKDCGGSEICEHGRQRSQCKDCGGSQICDHGKRRSQCKDCCGASICEHGRQRRQCKDCGGASICEHDNQRSQCKDCGGSSLCKTPKCETYGNPKYRGYCMRCFMYTFPGEKVARNYKVKEYAMVEFVQTQFPDVTWVHDKRISDGCSRKRPDLIADFGYFVMTIEADEHQHDTYDTTCEHRRLMELSQDVGHRPMVMIRFNPDSYEDKTTGETVPSCWGVNKLGISVVKKKQADNWTARLAKLAETIQHYIDQPEGAMDKMLTLEWLFFE